MADNTQSIPLVSTTGNIYKASPAELQELLSQGYTVPSHAELAAQEQQDKYGTPLEQVKTAAEGALSSSTFGLGTKAEADIFGNAKDQLARMQENPISRAVGQVAGLSTGPAGEAMGAVGAGAKALAGGEGILGSAASLAAQNALFQTSDEVSKHILNDPNQSLQTAASNIGLAGIFGGAFGGVGGIAGKGLSKVADTGVGEFVNDFRNRILEHTAPDIIQSTESRLSKSSIPNFPPKPNTPLFEDVPVTKPKPEIGKPETLGAKAADTFMKSKLAGQGLAFTAGEAAGRATGIPFAGTVLGGISGKVLGPTLDAVIKPIVRGIVSGSGFESAANLVGNVAKGNNNIVNAAKAIFDSSLDVVPAKLAPDQAKRDSLLKHLQESQSNPESMLNAGGNLHPYLPLHNSAVGQLVGSAVQHLSAIEPKPIKGASPLDSDIPVTKAQKAVFNRSLDIAEQPLQMLQHVKDGTLLPSDLATFMAIYPNLHPKMSQAITSALIDHKAKGKQVPYKTRMGMSLFMAQPMDSTMLPQHIQATQSIFAQAAQQAQQQQAPQKAKKSTAPLSKIGSQYSTPSQSRQARASKD